MSKKEHERMLEDFVSGNSVDAYKYLGSHIEKDSVVFKVWAPQALSVSVVGDFNNWDNEANYMTKIHENGIWEVRIKNAKSGDCYKYCVETKWNQKVLKTDPYAFNCELRPDNASKIYDYSGFEWGDSNWTKYKRMRNHRTSPMNIYEINAGSWKKHADGSFYTYRELADELVSYVADMGYTHIEFMPLTEFPFDGSWLSGKRIFCGYFKIWYSTGFDVSCQRVS